MPRIYRSSLCTLLLLPHYCRPSAFASQKSNTFLRCSPRVRTDFWFLWIFIRARKKRLTQPIASGDERWEMEREREEEKYISRMNCSSSSTKISRLLSIAVRIWYVETVEWVFGRNCATTQRQQQLQRDRKINIIKLLGLPDSDYVQSTVISEMRKMCFNSNFAFFFHISFIHSTHLVTLWVCVCCAVARIYVLHRWCISCHCIIQQPAKKFNQFVLTVQHSLTHTHVCIAKMLTYRCCACYCREKERGRQGLYTYITRVCFLILITTHTYTAHTHTPEQKTQSVK